jgi:serine/threonine protein kinase
MDPLEPGDPASVGSYRLLGRLGAGGMGQVFLGISLGGGRKVAVKLINPVHAQDLHFRERFAREIEAARLVGGFHTALVIDADANADPPWMVTAFIEGPTLQDAVGGSGALQPDEVRVLGAGLAEGLDAIHACGLVHRDLKPGNVIMAPDGPRIIDFGIARVLDGSTRISNSGPVVGTFLYMSPEQLVGDVTGPASDVFSLGGVLAFAATGQPPLIGLPPDLTKLADPKLAELISCCLAKSPEARPTVSDLLAALGGSGPKPLLAAAPGEVSAGAAARGASTPSPPQTPPETGPPREAPPGLLLPLLVGAPGDVDPDTVAGGVTPPPTPPEPGPQPQAAPGFLLLRAVTNRPRRWFTAPIAVVVFVAALAIVLATTLPFLLSSGTPPPTGGHRPYTTATTGGAAITSSATASTQDRGGTSPTVGGPSPRPQPTASSNPAAISPTAEPGRSPANPSGPASSPRSTPSSRSPTSARSTPSSSSPTSSKSPQLVDIPSTIGMTLTQATDKLQSVGFVVNVVRVSTGPGNVTHYSPVGRAPRGSTITIYC